jgi:hypothetical protein
MKLALLTLLLLPSLMGFSTNAQAPPEWKYLFTLEDDRDAWKTYYDTANIERQEQGTVRAWLKQIPVTKTDAERRRIVSGIIDNRKLNRMSTEGYDKFAFTLTLIEFDCSGRRGRSIAIKDYDQSGKLLGKDTKEGIPFAPVLKDSSSEVILEAVCK